MLLVTVIKSGFSPKALEVEEGTTVRRAVQLAGFDTEDVQVTLRSGANIEMDEYVTDGAVLSVGEKKVGA